MALKQTAHGVFNDESFPLREAASATSWGGTGTYDPACPDPFAPWLGDTQLDFHAASAPGERPQQPPCDEFASVLPLGVGPLEPVTCTQVFG